jgi:uncharacterized membrane protein YjgN (DUF898 family)
MTSTPTAPPAAPLQQGNSPLSSPQPLTTIDSYPLTFSATGSEYFRVWIVNLLLILVTVGIYLPWAKVRKLKYFYSNTRIDDHPLDFHGEPRKMLRGTAIVGVFFVVYYLAASMPSLVGSVAALALMVIWPLLFRAGMKFRLANTSWRGMRFRFVDTGVKPLYWLIVPPLVLMFLPGVLTVFYRPGADTTKGLDASSVAILIGAGLAYVSVLVFSAPYFFWRIKRYQHNNYAYGPLQAEYRSGVWHTYKIFGLTALMFIPITALFSGLVGVAPLLVIFYIISINIAPKAFFMARMQNLLWSRTGNRYFRFKSDLRARKFVGLQFKNYFLILLTLGLYWPFAVVATKRMQIEAMALKARVDLDTLTDAARQRENDAAGDMAADVFGLDIGM